MRAGNPTAQSRNPHPHTPAALSFVPLFAGPGNLPGSDWDLRSLREHRATLALDSGLPAWLVFLPFINCPAATSAPSFPLSFLSSWQVASWILGWTNSIDVFEVRIDARFHDVVHGLDELL